MKRITPYTSGLLSALAGFRHGFSVRAHGDMRRADIRAAFASHIGIAPESVVSPAQVHGVRVVSADSDTIPEGLDLSDGVVSGSRAPCVITADCIPILVADPVTGLSGAAHAGWRGTIGGIAGNLIREMVRQGAAADSVIVALGPHIGACCYTVDPARADLFAREFDGQVVVRGRDDVRLDLAAANVSVLLRSGVSGKNIDIIRDCTSCTDTFFSYRRRDRPFGETAAVIGRSKYI